MDVPAITPILPGPVAGSTAAEAASRQEPNAASADFQSFLRLLTAQLENQDPLAPLDATEFVAQLADFSSVEQLVSINQRLDALSEKSAAAEIAGIASWIGKDVAVKSGVFRATGDPVTFSVPPDSSGSIVARVKTFDGQVVARFSVTPGPDGTASWKGTDSKGNVVKGPDLWIELEQTDLNSGSTVAAAEVLRRVTGLRGTPSGLVFALADGGEVAPHDVIRLATPAP